MNKYFNKYFFLNIFLKNLYKYEINEIKHKSLLELF